MKKLYNIGPRTLMSNPGPQGSRVLIQFVAVYDTTDICLDTIQYNVYFIHH